MTGILLRAGAVLTAALALLLTAALPAAAHVSVYSAERTDDGATRITMGFNHACGDSPTVALTITLPPGATAVDAEPPDGWTADLADGVIELAGPEIPADREVGFAVTARISAQIGEAIVLPTLQRCANGEELDWAEVEESGNEPAPRFIATAANVAPAAAAGAGGDGNGAGPLAVAGAIGLFVVAAGALTAWRARSARR